MQVTIILEPPFYFTLRTGFDFRDTLFKFNRITMELESKKKIGFDVRLQRTLQVDMALYALQDGGVEFRRFTDLDNNRVTETMLTHSPTWRFASAMTHYLSRHIFVTGGKSQEGSGGPAELNTCDVYDTRSDIWYEGPRLKHARRNHSSCMLNHYVYVFFGGTDTIERLNARRFV